ncbi:MAG: PQQ-binding-like beta-propeller repeat protein [Myxococcota bacterium]
MRHAGKRTLAAVLVVAIVAGGVWVWMPVPRFVVGSVPIGVDEAILLTRRNDDTSRHWVELVAADGTLRWSAETTPVEVGEALGFTGAIAAGEQIILLGARQYPNPEVVVFALARSDGHRLWESTLPGTPPMGRAGRIGPMLVADAERVYVVDEIESDGRLHERLHTLSLATGAVSWERAALDGPPPLGHGVMVTPMKNDRLLASKPFESPAVELDPATGAITRRVPASRFLCQLPESWIGGNHDSVLSVPMDATQPIRTVELDAGESIPNEAPCGARGDDLILGVRTRTGEDFSTEGLAITRFDDATGQRRWTLPLGSPLFQDNAVLDGPLPRFLPIAVYGGDAAADSLGMTLLIVDLDAGTVVERVDVGEMYPTVLVTSGRAWVWWGGRAVLVEINPDTGRFGGATTYPGVYIGEPRLEDLRFGQLWVTGSGWARPQELPWDVIDLATGALVGANGGLVAREVPLSELGEGFANRGP